MVSYYHYVTGLANPTFSGSFAEFIRHRRFGLAKWFAHTRSWLRENPVRVDYNKLREDDITEYGRLFDRLSIAYGPETLVAAVERSRFDKVKQLEQQRGHPGAEERFRAGWRFMRNGTVGDWAENFEPADLELYETLCEQYPDVTRELAL
jgi:hypothetical protein